MRLLDGGAQLLAGERVVRLERCDTLRDPEINHLACLLRAADLMKLRDECVFAFEIRTGYPYFWADPLAGIDPLLQFKIGVRLDAAGSADGGQAIGEIKTREAESHLAINQSTHRIEKVIVHPDQTGNGSSPGPVEHLRSLWCGCAPARADG